MNLCRLDKVFLTIVAIGLVFPLVRCVTDTTIISKNESHQRFYKIYPELDEDSAGYSHLDGVSFDGAGYSDGGRLVYQGRYK